MRGHIRKRSENGWTIVLSLGRQPDTGRRRQKWVTVHGRRQDAEREMTRLLADYGRGTIPSVGRITVAEYLGQWLREVVARRNRPRTIEGYRRIARSYLIPALGAKQLSKLEASDVDRLLAGMVRQGLSNNTARHAYIALSKALKDAERRGLVSRNVCKLVDPPRVPAYVVDPPDFRAVRAILNTAAPSNYGPVLEFMARTGVRRGEAVALRWANVELDHGLALIVESAIRITGDGITVHPTKSAAGRRGIALDEGTVKLLRAHRARQLEEMLRLGPVYRDNGFVFPGPRGKIMDLDQLSQMFKVFAKRAGFPKVRLHDLRHAHAAGLIATGAYPRVVQERLGHASAAFTLQVYGHATIGLQLQAASAFGRLLANASG